MASIRKRGKTYAVIYTYQNDAGEKKQKWISGLEYQEAKRLKTEIEARKYAGTFVQPNAITVTQFLENWVDVYGKNHWQYSTYTTNTNLIRKYLLPRIGNVELQKLSPRDIDTFLSSLRSADHDLDHNAVERDALSPTTIRIIYMLLKGSLNKAVEWKLIQTNPVVCKAPKRNTAIPTVWDGDRILLALQHMESGLLHLAVHLSFICSMRIGEVMGLTWDCIDFEKDTILINKTCQRISKKALQELPAADLIAVFPTVQTDKKSVLVLKTPKTGGSIRKVYMTKPLKEELRLRKEQLNQQLQGGDSQILTHNLVFCLQQGRPMEPKLCEKWFQDWQKGSGLSLPPIKFHGLRHASTTYKLQVGHGDYKSVQCDNGHATANMTLNYYAHVSEQSRLQLLRAIENHFYSSDAEAPHGRTQEQSQDLRLAND